VTTRLRTLAVAIAGTAAVFAACVGVLELGLRSASPGEKIALRVLAELRRTRGVHAVMDVDGRRLLSTCHGFMGRDLLELSDGTRLVIVGIHAYRTLAPQASPIVAVSARRELFVVRRAPGLVSAQAAIAGSHSFWARILAVRLEQARVDVRDVLFRARPAYDIRLSSRPLLELIVDRRTLQPLAAVYRSRAVEASSLLVSAGRGGC